MSWSDFSCIRTHGTGFQFFDIVGNRRLACKHRFLRHNFLFCRCRWVMEKFAMLIQLLMSHINAFIDSNWVHIGSTLRVAPPFTLFLWSVLVSLQYTLHTHSLQQQSKPIDYAVRQVPILMRTHPIFTHEMDATSLPSLFCFVFFCGGLLPI